MKFIFSFIFSLSFLSLSWGLDNTAQDMAAPDKRALMAQGQLMTVKIVPADKQAKLFVLGKKVLQTNPNLKPQILQVTAFSGEQQEELHLTPEGEYYTVNNPNLNRPYRLRIRAKYDKSEEKFEVQVPKTVP